MKKVEVFTTTDLHGALPSFIEAEKVKEIKRKYPEAIWVDNGDFFVGNAWTTYNQVVNKLSPLVERANDFGYDVMIPGNHDFDYGLSFLKRQVNGLKMPYVCCNLFDLNGDLLFEPFTLIEKQGKKVAVIGLMTEALPQLGRFDMLREVICKNASEALRNTLSKLPESIDYVIVAYHGGLEKDLDSHKTLQYDTGENQAYALAEANEKIDAFIAGHQHFVNVGKIGETIFVQPGYKGEYLGQITLSDEGHVGDLHKINLPLLAQSPSFETWMEENVELNTIENFLATYFKVSREGIYYKSLGRTRRELLRSFPIPYTFSKYQFTLDEWKELGLEKEGLKNEETDSVILYSNDLSLPSYRIQERYIDNLFDAYHHDRGRKL
jgi:2',3'-cyclic-nucleotide 2'-phosphodiesterase/3'-nucleotidase